MRARGALLLRVALGPLGLALVLGPAVAGPVAVGPVAVGPVAVGPVAAAGVERLPIGTRWDYQLGGARPAPRGVGVVVRDRRARPAGRYDVCYVNAFQTQPGERRFWSRRPGLLLRRAHGGPVVDGAWNEVLLDLRTRAKRQRLARIVGRWLRGCSAAGFEAAELDNLDSFTRSGGLLRAWQATAYARLLTARAHVAGLAVAQKNRPGLDGRRLGFDFAIAEACARWRECGRYARTWGRRVLAVEYAGRPFRRACGWSGRLAVLRRDLALAPRGMRRWCRRG